MCSTPGSLCWAHRHRVAWNSVGSWCFSPWFWPRWSCRLVAEGEFSPDWRPSPWWSWDNYSSSRCIRGSTVQQHIFPEGWGSSCNARCCICHLIGSCIHEGLCSWSFYWCLCVLCPFYLSYGKWTFIAASGGVGESLGPGGPALPVHVHQTFPILLSIRKLQIHGTVYLNNYSMRETLRVRDDLLDIFSGE